jgi:hypothetical protein
MTFDPRKIPSFPFVDPDAARPVLERLGLGEPPSAEGESPMKDYNIRLAVPADANDFQSLYEPPVELATPPTGDPANPIE